MEERSAVSPILSQHDTIEVADSHSDPPTPPLPVQTEPEACNARNGVATSPSSSSLSAVEAVRDSADDELIKIKQELTVDQMQTVISTLKEQVTAIEGAGEQAMTMETSRAQGMQDQSPSENMHDRTTTQRRVRFASETHRADTEACMPGPSGADTRLETQSANVGAATHGRQNQVSTSTNACSEPPQVKKEPL